MDGSWKVRWSPAVLHPQLHEGQRFAVDVTAQERQPIVDRKGEALQGEATLYVASVIPATVRGPAEEVCERLSKITGLPRTGC